MHNELFSIGSVTIHGYGLMIAIGFLMNIIMTLRRADRYGVDKNAVIDIEIVGVIGGFIGAKLMYVIVEFPSFLKDPWAVLSSEGFVVYGGIILGALSGATYCWIRKLPTIKYFDMAGPAVVLAQAFGRIGCFLAGCCYGRTTDAWYGVTFPVGSMAPAGVKLIPTQLISAAGDFLIVIILVLFHRRAKHDGDVGALYMLLYGVGRFMIEFLRSDDRGTVGLLSTSQAVSIAIVAGGILMFIWNRFRDKRKMERAQKASKKA